MPSGSAKGSPSKRGGKTRETDSNSSPSRGKVKIKDEPDGTGTEESAGTGSETGAAGEPTSTTPRRRGRPHKQVAAENVNETPTPTDAPASSQEKPTAADLKRNSPRRRSRNNTESSTMSSSSRNPISDPNVEEDVKPTIDTKKGVSSPQPQKTNESVEKSTPTVKRGRGRPPGSKNIVVKEEVVEPTETEERLSMNNDRSGTPSASESSMPASPRRSRKRVPSRKLLESKMSETLLKEKSQSSPPMKKGRRSRIQSMQSDEGAVRSNSAASTPNRPSIPEVTNFVEIPSGSHENDVIVDDEPPEMTEFGESMGLAAEGHLVVGREEEIGDTVVEQGMQSPRRRKRVSFNDTSNVVEASDGQLPSTSSRDAPHTVDWKKRREAAEPSSDSVEPGADLPEEHRPRDRARPVMLQSGRTGKEGAGRVNGRPYFTTKEPVEMNEEEEEIPPPDELENMTTRADGKEIVREGGTGTEGEKNTGYTVIDENGREIVFEMGVNDFVEEVEYSEIPEGMEVIEEREVQNEDGTTSIIQSVAPRSGRSEHGMDNVVVKQEQPGNEEQNEDENDDAPPRLVPELGPTGAENARRQQEMYVDGENVIRVQSPGETQQFVHVARGEDGSEMYVDANGDEVQMVDETTVQQDDLRTVEFNFLDSKNICCGLCGEIVPYDNLMTHHLPNMHPEVLGDGTMNLEEIPYETWLRDKLFLEKKSMETGFRAFDSGAGEHSMRAQSSARTLRKVSQIRVNPVEMTLPQLEVALKKKMIEKMGRKVPVALVDKQHARCGICNSVVSLNKKFEIVHLVRHFNAWHPSAHRCAGTWQNRPVQIGTGKPLSIQDFAVIDVSIDAPDNLQCIWCGMFMDRNALAMHFTEVHPDEIEVPKCLLCLQELVINARLLEKYGEDFEVVLPDEFHVKCHKFEQTYRSEAILDKAIARRVEKMQLAAANNDSLDDDEENLDEEGGNSNHTNSRMQFGRRNKPKRSFVQPCFRQAIPANSRYVEAVSECQWRCKLCSGNIFGAVISAGAIKHYKLHHPGEMENMQYELCKARLERVSDGCMEFVHPQLVECLLCNLTYALHKPYNMCRGIRHLKAKHPEMMPEFTGNTNQSDYGNRTANGATRGDARGGRGAAIQMGETIDDPEMIARFKNEYNVDFEKVQTLYGADGEPVYVLLGANEELDPDTARQLATSLEETSGTTVAGDRAGQNERRQTDQQKRQSSVDIFDEEDPFGELREDEEIANMERKTGGNAYGARNMHDNRMPREIVVDENGRETTFDGTAVIEEEAPPNGENMQITHEEEVGGEVYAEEIVQTFDDIYEDENGQVFLEGEHAMAGEYLEEEQIEFMEEETYVETAGEQTQ